jgi:hypothetical protein
MNTRHRRECSNQCCNCRGIMEVGATVPVNQMEDKDALKWARADAHWMDDSAHERDAYQ